MAAVNDISIVLRATGADQLANELKRVSGAAEQMSSRIESAVKSMAAAFLTYKLLDYAKDAALLAARYDTLGVVMNTVGATAGYTNSQMKGFQESLQKQGIALVESRQALTQMASAHMDLTKSSELARIAQDAAVNGNMNSSEAFEKMITGIQRGETEIMKTLGINVDFEKAHQKLAIQLNKTTDDLTQNEKVQANMNATMLKGKDIAGVYEAAMGTAGKQISSMKRYIDDLKVVSGGVFNDILIVAVEAFTGSLKSANKEAEDLAIKGQLRDWGKNIVMGVATVADGLMIAYHALNTLVITGVAGFSQLYHGSMAFGKALIGDFSGAKESFGEFMAVGSTWAGLVSEQWKDTTKFQDAANKMYADRENAATKAVEAQKKADLEQKQMAAGIAADAQSKADQLELAIKKHQAAWEKIYVTQLESNGEYVKAAEKQIEINNLTQDHKSLVNAAKDSEMARNLLKAEEINNSNKLLEAKRKELELENTHVAAMESLKVAKMVAQGMSQEEANLTRATVAMRNEEKALQDQINTETNPIKKKYMEEELAARQSVNYYLREQNELELRIVKSREESGKLNETIKLAMLNGNTELAKKLSTEATISSYDGKRAELMKAHNYEALQQLDILYSQKDATAENMKKLQEYLGVQQSVTEEMKKQHISTVAEAGADGGLAGFYKLPTGKGANGEILGSQLSRDKFNSGDARFVTLDDWKYQQMMKMYREQEEKKNAELIKIANEQRIEQLKISIESYTKMISVQTDAMLKLTQQQSASFKSMAEALQKVTLTLLQARIDIAGGSSSILSPQQKYELAKAQFSQTAAQAQTTGSADLYNQLPQLAKAFLDASRGYNASGAAFGTDYANVQQILLESADKATTQANYAANMVTILTEQERLLGLIKDALATNNAGSLPALLTAMDTTNGQIVTATNSVNTSVGGTTSAVNTQVAGVTGAVNTGLGSAGTLSGLMGSVKTYTGNVATYTSATGTGGMGITLANSTLGKIGTQGLAGQIKEVNRYASGTLMDTTKYTYYAKGGIADRASIFGEAGPEAAVPLPDGRSIPVTLSGTQSADNRETIAELKAIIRVLQAAHGEVMDVLTWQAKGTDSIANSARLKAAA